MTEPNSGGHGKMKDNRDKGGAAKYSVQLEEAT